MQSKRTLPNLAGLLFGFSLAVAVSGGICSSQAVPISDSVVWQNATGIDGFGNDGNFNAAFITFPGFQADTLVSASGAGYFHTHSAAPETMFLDLRIDNVWTQVFTATTVSVSPVSGDNILSSIISDVGFTLGTVDGLRLRAQIGVNQTYHNMFNEVFNFGTAISVPEPSTVALFATGLVGLGFFGRRRGRALRLKAG